MNERTQSLHCFKPASKLFQSRHLQWRDVEPGMKITSQFNITHWHSIMPFACSEEDVYAFLESARNYAKMYVLEDVSSGKLFGICLLIVSNIRKKIVNLHGGIIMKNYSPLKCCNGLLIMLDSLMNAGWNVRSRSTNIRAYRIIKPLGFRICGYYNGYIYSYVNPTLFQVSPMYLRAVKHMEP